MSKIYTLQLTKIKRVHELRVREALTQVHEQQKSVFALQAKVQEIQACADALAEQLSSLDAHRLHSQKLTVLMLHEEVASRSIVQRDLRKEQLYLETAIDDVSDGVAELVKKRAQWRKHVQRLDALSVLTQYQHKLELRQVQRLADRATDDQSIGRPSVRSHG